MRRLKSAVVLSLALAVWSARAQEHHMVREAPPEIAFPEGKASVSIPFSDVGNHVVLKASVNGSKPLSLVLDTGMPMGGVLLYENDTVKALGLTYGDMRVQVGGAGGSGAPVEARVAEGVRVTLGDLELKGMRAVVMPRLAQFPGGNDGVIGAALFRSFTVRVNQDRGEVELIRPGRFTPAAGAASVPLSFAQGVPMVPAEVTMTSVGAPVPVTLVVDTGAMHAVTLNASSDARITVPANALETRLGRGVSGAVLGAVGRIAALSVGGLTFPNVVAGFPSKEHESPRGADSRNGNLGMAILRQGNVTFDYAAAKMYLERSRRYPQPFEWDMSGMVLEPAEGGGLVLAAVSGASPAEEAGLKAGDRILRLAGEAVGGDDLLRLRELLRRDGEKLAVTVQRDGESRDVTLRLRRRV